LKPLFLLTPEAKGDLKEILLDIADDSPDTAERLRSEFFEGLQKLGRSPGIGHYHDELLSRKYRFWNFYSYVIAYVWQAKPIQVISIVHGARDLAIFFAHRVGQDE
jgi:plasmid stabilization system protein ParE